MARQYRRFGSSIVSVFVSFQQGDNLIEPSPALFLSIVVIDELLILLFCLWIFVLFVLFYFFGFVFLLASSTEQNKQKKRANRTKFEEASR